MTTKITNDNIADNSITVDKLAPSLIANLYTAGDNITIEANGRISATISAGAVDSEDVTISRPNCLAVIDLHKNSLKIGTSGIYSTYNSGLTTSEIGSVDGIAFDPDGTRMYLLNRPTDEIYQFSLADPFLVANARYSGNMYFIVPTVECWDLIFKPDGTKCYSVSGSGTVGIIELELSTPWDISTAAISNTFTTSSEETGPKALHIGDDGNKLFLLGSGSDTIYEYALADPWNVGSISYTGNSYATGEGTPYSLFFSDDGTKFYTHGTTGDTLAEYRMTSPWNINTVSQVKELINFEGTIASPHTIKAANAGNNVFLVDITDDRIVSYYSPVAWDYGVGFFNITTQTAETTPFSFYISPTGHRLYIQGSAIDKVLEFELNTPYDISTANVTGNELSVTATSSGRSVSFNDDGNILVLSYLAADELDRYTLSTPWDISTATLSNSTTFSVMNLISPLMVRFNGDGTKMYGSRSSTTEYADLILTYTCASPYDTGNVSIQDPYYFASDLLGYHIGINSVHWNEDGSKVYLLATTGSINRATVLEYTASTPYSLWSVNWDSVKKLDLKYWFGSTGGSTIRDIQFRGDYFYFLDSTVDCIYQLRLK